MAISRLVIATHNAKKAGEMVTILSGHFPELEIRTLADYPNAPEPEETGTTYAENSLIKVLSAVEATGEWCVADDAGLEIDAMGGEPGLYSKRFAGEDTPFPEKMRIILERLSGIEEAGRGARFVCSVALASPAGESRVFQSTCEGKISTAPSGNGGFGYDPIFWLPEQGRTMADLTAEEKHQISHRGKVLRQLRDYLATL